MYGKPVHIKKKMQGWRKRPGLRGYEEKIPP